MASRTRPTVVPLVFLALAALGLPGSAAPVQPSRVAPPAALPAAAGAERVVFASYAVGTAQGRKAAVLVRSIRAHAGSYAVARVFVATDESAAAVLEREEDPGLRLLPFQVPAVARRVPLAAKAYAAARIEEAVSPGAETMIWIDPECVVLREPEGLALGRGKLVALQPVFLSNDVGLPAAAPVNGYWSGIYEAVGLAVASVPAVRTAVDGTLVRFYINCGVIAFRPGRGLCAEWARVLTALLADERYRALALGEPRLALFLHQAVLSGVVCARTGERERQWIPIVDGYPLGSHARVPAGRRAASLDEVTCLIYDQVWDRDPAWMDELPVSPRLAAWLREAHRATFQLAGGIYREEGSCNTYLFRAGSGWVVVDPGTAPARDSPLRAIAAGAPLHAILLTHAHLDHRAGLDAWKDGRDVPVLAHRRHADLLADQAAIAGLLAIRNATLAGEPRPVAAPVPAPALRATDVFDARRSFSFGGRRLEVIPVGGETPDTTLVWVPDEKALIVADDYYSEFPNLSTPRGAKPRPALEYVRAMEIALALEPELLLPGHGEPVIGQARVAAHVRRYRDAIRYVHDEVLRGMNQGKDALTLAREISLPEPLRLGEAFGRVSWAVRGIYEGYAGWFDGRTASLYAEPPEPLQAELARLCGGAGRLAARARELAAAGQAVRALQLTDAALAAEPGNGPALAARLEALRALLAAAGNYFERAWLQQDERATAAAWAAASKPGAAAK